ncbi:helix-turn-helix domain-containing protein [Vallitalea sediminicola]
MNTIYNGCDLTLEILIKEYRLKKDLSIRDLERISEINRSVISRIENNKTYYPNIFTVCKLATALKISLNDLVKY